VRTLRRLLRFLTFVALAVAGVVAYRRRFAAARERVDLYHQDGTLVSVEDGSAACNRLLPLARDVVAAARA
jgi:hypothetical protein